MAVPQVAAMPGTLRTVNLLLTDPVVGDPSFVPGSIAAASTGSGSSQLPVYPTIQEGPTGNGGVTRFIVGAQDSGNQDLSFVGAGPGVGMMYVQAYNYAYDPSFLQFGNRQARRGTGGNLDVVNPLYAEGAATEDTGDRAGQDVRAFLYAVDNATPTQAVRLRADATGSLNVNTAGAAPATITTVVDIAMVAATNTSLAAINLARTQIIIQNTSAVATEIVRIGDTNIAAARGIRLGPGESLTLAVTAEIFGRPEAGTPSLTVTEIEA